MRTTRLAVALFIAAITVGIVGCAPDTATPPPADASEQQVGQQEAYVARTDDGVDVVYFEVAKPCDCMAEVGDAVALSIDNSFAAELQNGELRFFEIVSDDAQNKSVLETFEAQPFDLFIVRYEGGNSTAEPVYEIWNLMGDNEAIGEYVRVAVEASLKSPA
ncbi:hypothetical protein ACFLUT_00245 [Chloroflexota bacterium]